jgi:MoaA/NifB/PqqE/SkfB family radical SAM enzyme
LTTNGLLLTDETARQLGRRELVWLNVSLEGPDAQTNDAIRGRGTFEAVLEKLQVLRRHTRFTLAFTILRSNAHLVTQCAELAYRVGAQTAVFRPLYPVGVALHHPDLMPGFSQYSDALHELADMASPGADLRSLDAFGPESRSATQPRIHTSHTCGAGQHVCSISVQGDINPCSFLGPAFNAGNIRETPFAVLWNNSQPFRRLRGPSPGGFEGGCRARAQVFAGSADAPDPWFEEYQRSRSMLPPGANLEAQLQPSSRFSYNLPIVSAPEESPRAS